MEATPILRVTPYYRARCLPEAPNQGTVFGSELEMNEGNECSSVKIVQEHYCSNFTLLYNEELNIAVSM